ncbi:hypothetical protein CFIO01_11753 [Colletotrichum fioriniae PJ7]|uniref:Myb-like domain-containing protein n=1 Tax=Colletotrichum fioriniae PJ7 TaxID=1445577 RepID=A0A010QWN2_9PEZI|nr:hypothetical protein CFIO01_11753 [Colletotrichum fioriniae PJ7]
MSTNSGGRMCLDSPGIVCADIGVQRGPLGVLAVLLRRQHGSVNALRSSLNIDYLNESVWLIDFDTLIFSNIRPLELSNVQPKMPINLDNISFYSAPAQVVRPLAARSTIRQTLSPSSSVMGRTAIPPSDDTTTTLDQDKSHSDKNPIVSSQSLPESNVEGKVNSKERPYLRIERCPASGDMGHSSAKKPVAVDFNTRGNSPETAAWSANCLPVSLHSLPSEAFAAAMFPSHPDPDPQAANNTADQALPQKSTKNASTVRSETPAPERTPPNTEHPPQVSQAADDDFTIWLQHQQVGPSSSAEVGEAPESPRGPAEKSGTMPSPALAENGLPYSSLASVGQDTPCHAEDCTRQPLSGQETPDPWPNVGGEESSPGSTDRSEPLITETAFHCSNCSPSPDEMHLDAETTASDAPPVHLSRVHRRARKSRLPVGAYAEVDSDPESSDEDGAHGTNEDCFGDQANPDRIRRGPQSREDNSDQRGQPKPKRRKRNFQDTVSTSRALRPRDTSSHLALQPRRRSERATKRPGTNGVLTPPVSPAPTDSEIDPRSFFARYDEWPLNAVLKRITDGPVTTFQLQWEQPSTEGQQTHCHPSVSRPSGSSLKRRKSARRSAKSRGPFSEQENKLLIQLKGRGLSWRKIHSSFSSSFPGRSLGTLQVHFSTKLKMRR